MLLLISLLWGLGLGKPFQRCVKHAGGGWHCRCLLHWFAGNAAMGPGLGKTTLPLTGMLSMAGAAWLRRGRSQQHSQQIGAAGPTTSPAVAQAQDQREELLNNGALKAAASHPVLFTDTASFQQSQRPQPSRLMDWLNRGMAICVPAVTRRGSMVNKFTGDGMYGVWRARLPGSAAEAAAAWQQHRRFRQDSNN